MTLRGQMLVAGLLALLLPLSGWRSVRELDEVLRDGRAAAQRLALAELELALHREGLSGATVITDEAGADDPARPMATRSPRELYAERAVAPLQIDGYADDWRELADVALRIDDAGGGLAVRAAEHRGRLYLMIDLTDASPVYHRPPRLTPDAGEGELPDALSRIATGDAVQVFLHDGVRRQHAVLSPIAPGGVSVRAASPGPLGSGIVIGTPLSDWQAAWTDRPGGHRIEISLPLHPADEAPVWLGVAAIDVPFHGGTAHARGTVPPLTMSRLHRRTDIELENQVPRLYRSSRAVERVLEQQVPAGARARAFDGVGRLLADVDRLNAARRNRDAAPFASLADAILFRVFAFLVAGDLPLPERAYAEQEVRLRPPSGIEPASDAMRELTNTRRYVTPELDRVLGTLRRLDPQQGADGRAATRGWLWYETNEEHSATYAGSRLARVFALLFLAGALASVLFFGWASWLSMRIRRLSRATMRAVAHDGRVREGGFPSSRARDEIGDLSRDLGRLLQRSGDYHRYLEALGGRLSHELRTPLAVLAGSLEHLRGPQGMARRDELLARADEAAQELDVMIESLVASTRLEQTLQRAARERLSLDPLLGRCRERHTLRQHAVTIGLECLPIGSSSPRLDAAPELLVQAIDRLVDNAIDFSPVDSATTPGVTILRRVRGDRVFIGVSNRASADVLGLDAVSRREWFEPTFSKRKAGNGAHLGLGLHLVALVAGHHGGSPDTVLGSSHIAVGLWLPLVSLSAASAPDGPRDQARDQARDRRRDRPRE